METDGGALLGFCTHHNAKCLFDFYETVKIGAWSSKLLISRLLEFAKSWVDKINLDSPISDDSIPDSPPSGSPPPYFKMDINDLEPPMSWRHQPASPSKLVFEIPDQHSGWVCLPNYDDVINLQNEAESHDDFDLSDFVDFM